MTVAYPARHYLNAQTTARSWIFSLDHKRIAVMYAVFILISLFLGGVFALVMRLELLTPGPSMVDALTYNRLFTLHGVVMVFLFMIPGIPSIFGNFLLPIMIGAAVVRRRMSGTPAPMRSCRRFAAHWPVAQPLVVQRISP